MPGSGEASPGVGVTETTGNTAYIDTCANEPAAAVRPPESPGNSSDLQVGHPDEEPLGLQFRQTWRVSTALVMSSNTSSTSCSPLTSRSIPRLA